MFRLISVDVKKSIDFQTLILNVASLWSTDSSSSSSSTGFSKKAIESSTLSNILSPS